MRNIAHRDHAVVFSHGKGANALGIVRSLGRSGIPVHLVYSGGKVNLAAKSRYCGASYEVHHYDDPQLGDWILDECSGGGGPPIAFFDNDRMLSAWIQGNFLSGVEFVSTSPRECSRLLLDKKKQTELAIQSGFAVPASFFPGTEDETTEIFSHGERRIVVKGRYAGESKSVSFKVKEIRSLLELRKLFQESRIIANELMFQDFIEGDDGDIWFAMCYFGVDREHSVVVTGRKLAQSGGGVGGVMVLGITEENEEMSGLCFDFGEASGYKGIIGIEAKYSRTDGKYYFIEVNARPEACNNFAAAAGVNINVLAFRDLTGDRGGADFSVRQRQTAWINGGGFIKSMVRRRDWRMVKLLLGNAGRLGGCSVAALDDLRPFLGTLRRDL